jgi:acyl-CoA synthetase (AMP-forming)/AMP-acid ligase II
MDRTTVGELYDRCVTHYGPRVALRFRERTCTFAELGEKAHRLANAFQELGFGKGDRVAFLMANCPEYVFTEYALARLGAVRVPLAILLGSDHHVYMMNHSRSVALVYHEKLAARVQEMLPRLETVRHAICVSEDPGAVPAGHLHLQTLMADSSPEPPEVAVEATDLCGLYYTGGTTGRPKGVMLSHRAWVNTVLLEMLSLGLGERETFAYVTPLTHAAGVLLLPVLLRGGTALILEEFDPETFLDTVEKENVTATFCVPTMIYMLLDHPGAGRRGAGSLRNVVYGAAPIAPERLKQALERFGPVFTQLYGQTEAPMMLSVLTRDEHVETDPERERRVLSSCGRPTVTTQMKLLDPRGVEVRTGEVGEIVVRAINVMDGYFEDPATTAEAMREGWLHTGDLAYRDAEGFLYIVDRAKDMIISGGFNIYPREVEDVLFEHPMVKEAAVIGVPHDKWGEAVKAIVVLHAGKSASEEELIAFVKERKGKLAAPKSVEFRDSIPLTNLGKVDKKKIREPFWQQREKRV